MQLIPPSLHFRRRTQDRLRGGPVLRHRKTTPWPAGRHAATGGRELVRRRGNERARRSSRSRRSARWRRAAGPHLLIAVGAQRGRPRDAAEREIATHLQADAWCSSRTSPSRCTTGGDAFPQRRAVVAHDAADWRRPLRSGDSKRVRAAARRRQRRPTSSSCSPARARSTRAWARAVRGRARLPRARRRVRRRRWRRSWPRTAHAGVRRRRCGATPKPAADRDGTQPALFVIEYALATAVASAGLGPSALIGHSVGEFVAAALAGVMHAPIAVRLVAERGQLMQALPPGVDALGAAVRRPIDPRLTGGLGLAAENCPSLCVVSGPTRRGGALSRAARSRRDRLPGARDLARLSLADDGSRRSPLSARGWGRCRSARRKSPSSRR